jgi:hypothetical protein
MIEKLKPLNVMNLFETPIAVVVRERSFLIELQNFITYCNDFYNIENGIYPIATSEEIEAAIGEYLTSPHEVDIQFDSFDREQVRELIGR